APELVQPMSRLCGVVLQASAEPDEVAVFLFADGVLRGPVGFSTVGMRIQNEQSGSSSLFAQPMALEAMPERQGTGNREQGLADENQGAWGRDQEPGTRAPRGLLESRMEDVLEQLYKTGSRADAAVRQGHLALLKRWYYRPEVRRVGEIFFPDAEGRWPVKAMLRGVGRIAAKALTEARP
ncbi:MAG TPA: hypothetical protein VN151_02265, partial [Terracidiphilus sp.]|nr:hypothetical protein [Terracidiphilus sp.]